MPLCLHKIGARHARHAFASLAALLAFSATPRPAHAITINIEYTDEGDTPPHDENPRSGDPDGMILTKHFQRAKAIWEGLLLTL